MLKTRLQQQRLHPWRLVSATEGTAPSVAPVNLQVQNDFQPPVNRLPREIFIFIAIYVTAEDRTCYKMLIHLTHVCAQWRHVLIACPTFWTHIRFGGADMTSSIASLFFERAQQCALDVHVSFAQFIPKRRKRIPLAPRFLVIPELASERRIRSLFASEPTWGQTQGLLGGWTDALSQIQELELTTDEEHPPPSTLTTFVWDALRSLTLAGFAAPGLHNIKAPNLTVLKFWDSSYTPLSVVALFDFFDAAPSLEDVSIGSSMVYEFPPSNRKVTLSHVQRIDLFIGGAPRIASHLTCPSITYTRLTDALPDDPNDSLFPPELQRLLGQYSVKEIINVIMRVFDRNECQLCSLEFRDPSGTTFRTTRKTFNHDPLQPVPDDVWPFPVLFDQAISTLLPLPLGQVASFSVDMREASDFEVDSDHVRGSLAEAFEKCKNLRAVVLESYSPGLFPDISGEKMPPIRVLVVKHPEGVGWEEFVNNVTEAAQARHSRGAPLDRVEIITTEEHPKVEQLEILAQEVEYRVIESNYPYP
ncbi:hypothetical protein BJ322DRAFT_551526 [Thelephora terrestris]|uniref:F-box domain-containing protein n=1 Tax=Thelephora terrestris TaxID=56493 RepID=A0A9P6LAN2_9AGAM|nr:hypothetical protein BJ322DRAFT_551526 [Thelephora terrestris]